MEIDFNTISHNWNEITKLVENKANKCGREPADIKIVAVSKTHPSSVLIDGIKAGINLFGENYAQEMAEKFEDIKNSGLALPEFHFIGHLQTNKVKYIAPFVSLIHSVDSVHLAEEISKQAEKNNRTIDILLQVNTSGEPSKSGCEPEELIKIYEQAVHLKNISIKGVMTIGSFSEDETTIRREFRILKGLSEELRAFSTTHSPKEISMGMSGDFLIAVEEGATMLRIGTAIFGQRFYPA